MAAKLRVLEAYANAESNEAKKAKLKTKEGKKPKLVSSNNSIF